MSSHPHAVAKINELFPKLTDPDADFRFMALNDLYEVLSTSQPTLLTSDAHLSQRISDGVVHALNDKNGEVQNMAVKW
jgi:cullin-associated NEDD8-dissociated protein 1